MKISILFEEFIAFATLERCLEPTTIEWYKRSLAPLLKYLRYKMLKADLEVLTTETLRGFFVSHRLNGNSPRTILNIMQGIKSFCSFLVKRGYLEENPCNSLEKPKLARRLPDFLDEGEAKELLQACISLKRNYKSKWYRDVSIISIFLLTGIRKRETSKVK